MAEFSAAQSLFSLPADPMHMFNCAILKFCNFVSNDGATNPMQPCNLKGQCHKNCFQTETVSERIGPTDVPEPLFEYFYSPFNLL